MRLDPGIVCANCARLMKCVKNGTDVVDPSVGGFPATIFSGDKYQCPSCLAEVVIGFGEGRQPVSGEDIGAIILKR